jgi:hypothetical protein
VLNLCACRKRAQSIAERQADDEGRVDRVERTWFEIRERENSGLSVELMAARPEITFRKWKLSSERNQRGAGDTSWRLMPRLCGANCGCRGSASSGAKNRLAAICLFLLPVLRTVSAHAFARLCGTVPAISQNGSLSSWLMRLSVLRGVPAERRLCFAGSLF